MKLGVSMYSYYRLWKAEILDIPGFIEIARKIGADGVELLAPMWRDIDAEFPTVEAALKASTLPVGVYSVSNDFVNADEAERAAHVKRITDGVDVALRLEAGVVRVFAGNTKEGISFDQSFHWIVDGLKEAADYAGMKGVKLALENHGLLAGKSHQVQRILDAVGSPALGANPDTGNFLLVHEAPHDALHALASSANMAHFKDFKEVPENHEGFAYTSLDGLKYVGTAIGEGDVALEACVKELKAANFNGWLNIEYEGTEDPMTALPRSVAYARGLITEI
jgi:sugar phosphate isomerase/epimerase